MTPFSLNPEINQIKQMHFIRVVIVAGLYLIGWPIIAGCVALMVGVVGLNAK